jgi:hypothetical protein
MPDARTTITELVTGLGTLGFDGVEEALAARPPAMVSVSPALWDDLDRWWNGAYRVEFEAAFANGRALLRALDGLRGRTPLVVDWRGTAKPVDDELVPADLRIDHVYLVSCKYLSKIVANAAPARLFDGLLRLRTPSERTSWFDVVAPEETGALLRAACEATGVGPEDRRALASALGGRTWPEPCRVPWATVCAAVSARSAERWRAAMETETDRLRLLWKLLRIGPTPYFVLGVGDRGPLRLRVQTSWDWSARHRLEGFEVEARPGGQPMVGWHALVRDRDLGRLLDVRGHVEIRWSHGRFNGAPEAKVYLDTPHAEVPGYLPLR